MSFKTGLVPVKAHEFAFYCQEYLDWMLKSIDERIETEIQKEMSEGISIFGKRFFVVDREKAIKNLGADRWNDYNFLKIRRKYGDDIIAMKSLISSSEFAVDGIMYVPPEIVDLVHRNTEDR